MATESKEFPSAAVAECPYPFYDEGRKDTPVRRLGDGNVFLIFRHADIATVLRDTDRFSAVLPGDGHAGGLDYGGATHILGTDPPGHKLKRELAAAPFKPGRLVQSRPRIQELVDQLIDAFIDRGSVELVSELAYPLPALVTCDLMGLPTDGEIFDFIRRWTFKWIEVSKPVGAAGEDAESDLLPRMQVYMGNQIQQRFEAPTDDILSELIQTQIARDSSFDHALCTTIAIELLAGGVITTGQMIASAMLLMLRNPEQMHIVQNDRGRIPAMLEESLRVESPVQWQQRTARVDTELGGVQIPAGSVLTLLYGAGNRDEAVFESPEEFRLRRTNVKQHFGFGLGIHFCLGAPLARLEGTVAFDRLFYRTQNIRLVEDESDTRNIESVLFRAPRTLHLRFEKT
jgi:cytochrome P450